MKKEIDEALRQEAARCLEVLKNGGLILYPTDTLWGIGCDATNAAAVEKIYQLKQSENKKSMLVLAEDADHAAQYTDGVPDIAWDLMEVDDKPLTLILPGAHGVAANLIPEEGTLGVRVPKHDFCNYLLHRFGKPIVSTSANISGEKAAARLKEVSPEILGGVDLVVDERFEGHPTFKPSSIIMIDSDAGVKIIRP